MAKTTRKKISVKTSAAKPSGKPLLGDKTLGLDPAIWLYPIEDGDENEEGEEAEIFIIHDSSLAEAKQNIVKRKFPYIDKFNHEGTTTVSAMRDLSVGVF